MEIKTTAEILNASFDKIYVINLARATDRRAHVEKILKDVNFEFLVATDKHNINYETALKEGVFDEHNANHMSRFPIKLTEAHIACALSHRRVYEDIVENNYQRVMIFEDDVTALPEPQNMELAFAELPDNWDVFLLGHMATRMLNTKNKINQNIYRLLRKLKLFNWGRRSEAYINNRYTSQFSSNLLQIGEFWGLHAYAVSAQGAKKLVKAQQPIRYTADGLVNYINLQEGKLNLYGISPSLFSQESQTGMFASEITDYRPKEDNA